MSGWSCSWQGERKKGTVVFVFGLLVGIVGYSASSTRSSPKENGFRMLAPKRMKSVIQAHRKASQEYVRQYRLAYRDGLDISQQSGFEENAGVVNNLEAAAKGTREDLGERGTVVNDGKFALVVSVYKEWGNNAENVPEWANANALRDNYFVVQPFYQRIDTNKPAFVVNNGFESGVYMRYIIDNYYNLPEAVIFVQADGCGVDMNTILPRVTTEILDEAGGFLPLNCLKVMGRPLSMWGGKRERVEACWREVSKHFQLNLFEGFPVGSDFRINMVCCACFAVKKELLLSTPFEVWNSFYEHSIVKGQCIEGQLDIDGGKHETAGTFEHLAHVIFGRKERLWEPKCISDFDQNQETSRASQKNIVHEGPNDTKVNVQNTMDRIEKWQPKYTPEKAEQCLAQKYKGTRNGSIAQSSTNILVYGNSVSRRFYQLLSAYLLSVSGTEEDALAAQEHRLMTRQEEKVKCNKELPGISCSTEIIYSKDSVGQRKIVVYFHFEQRIWSKNLEAVITETAPQIVIGNAGLDNYFCQHTQHDEPKCGEDKSLSSIQNSLEGSAEWEEQIKTWKLNLVERADKLADLVNSVKSKFGTKFVWRKSTCVCTKWNSMPSSYAHSKHNETLLNWFLNTSDSIVQERLKLDSNNILDASDLTRLNTEPYAKVCELYEDHVHPKRRIHDILIDDMLGLLCSAEPKGNVEENRVDGITNTGQRAIENTLRTPPRAFRLLSNKLMENQYRDLCASACFYSPKFSANVGLGSILHIIVGALTFAIEDGCVLIATSGSTLSRYNGSDSSPFKTLTNCKEEDAKDIKYLDFGVSDFDENGMRARYMRYAPQFDDLGFKVSITLWQSVALSFLMRTTENFANIIQEAQNEIGWYDIQKCNGAVISIHVRHGDKSSEASLLPLSAYLKELELWLVKNADQPQQFKCIFVATDDKNLRKRLEDSSILELESGRKFNVIGSWQSTVAAQKLSSFAEGGVVLDLHLLSKARALCFTFSSNFGRVAMHMNPMHLIPIREDRTVSSVIPMDYYHHAFSSGFFFVYQRSGHTGFWSTVAVYEDKISSTLNCDPSKGCSVVPAISSSQKETYSCCKVPANSDYINGVIGPMLSENFPDEFDKYAFDSVHSATVKNDDT